MSGFFNFGHKAKFNRQYLFTQEGYLLKIFYVNKQSCFQAKFKTTELILGLKQFMFKK